VIELLVSYLTDPDVNVVKSASACLKEVLRNSIVQDMVASELEGMPAFLAPYYSRIRKGAFSPPRVGISETTAWQVEGKSSSEWIVNQSAWLSEKLNDEVLSLCAEMCKVKSQFAEKIYPYLVYQSLQADNVGNFAMALAKNFGKHLLSSRNNDKEKLRLTLDVLNFIRRQTTLDSRSSLDAHHSSRRSMASKSVIETHFFAYLDFFEIAKAALRCDAPLTSLVYLEMWCERTFGELRIPSPSDNNNRSVGVSDLLLEIFSNIDEPDSIYGIAFSGDINSQLRTYEHEGAWYKTLTRYNALLHESQKKVGSLSSPQNASSPLLSQQYRQGILSSLQNLGLNNLLSFYLRGVATDMPDQFVQLSEFQYQVAWQSCKWDIEKNYSQLLDPSAEKEGVLGFHAGVYRCLQALHSGDQLVFNNTLTKLYESLSTDIAVTTTSESLKPFYPILAKLDFLNDLSESWSLHPTTSTSSSSSSFVSSCPFTSSLVTSQTLPGTNGRLKQTLESWSQKEEALAKKCSFELLEPTFSLRGVILSLVGQKGDVVSHLQSLAAVARRQQRFEIASNAIFQIKSMTQKDDFEWRLDEAKVPPFSLFLLSHPNELGFLDFVGSRRT
jgi:ataxia telangiectasia mutated family protein